MVTIISATNRPGSSTLKLSKYYQKKLKEKGLEAGLLSLSQLPGNLIESDMYGKHSAEFKSIQDIITQTQKFLFFCENFFVDTVKCRTTQA